MPIKLNGATSGSVELGVPDVVGSDVQNVLLPSIAGTLDRLERSGNILQVKQAVKADRTSTVGYTWADTGLSVDITPTTTTSNILVMANIHLGGTNGYDLKIRFVRDTTVIGVGDGDNGRPAVTSVLNVYDDTASTGTYGQGLTGTTYLDTAISTTSQVTYKVQFASYSTQVAYVNRSGAYQLSTAATPQYDGTPISTLTLMEVAG
jgi:hypothetical protein